MFQECCSSWSAVKSTDKRLLFADLTSGSDVIDFARPKELNIFSSSSFHCGFFNCLLLYIYYP